MEPITHGEHTGYTYRQAKDLIGCAELNYVRQIVTAGKIRIVAQVPVKEGSTVVRTLLNVDDVLAYAKHFKQRVGDGTNIYQFRATLDELKQIHEALAAQGITVELSNITQERREYQADRKSRKAE